MNKLIKESLVASALVMGSMGSCKPVSATELVVSGFSHHFSAREFNEVNPGLGIWYDLSENTAVTLGTYKNSVGKQTVYAGGSSHLLGRGTVQLRLDFGLATGYAYDVIPVVLPVVEVHTGPITTRFLGVPKVSENTATAIGVQWRVKF